MAADTSLRVYFLASRQIRRGSRRVLREQRHQAVDEGHHHGCYDPSTGSFLTISVLVPLLNHLKTLDFVNAPCQVLGRPPCSSEKDFDCLASTGVGSPGALSP